jgi:holo-[acyl-carrier protein] synthase
MILGIGIDIIEVHRVLEKVNKGNGFKEKIFSPAEIHFCETQATEGENYAARFAAKEAFLKATGQGLTLGHELADIEVAHDDFGKPYIRLKGTFKEQAAKNNWNKIHLSVSHLHATAVAVVIIEA